MKRTLEDLCKRSYEVLVSPRTGFRNLISRPLHWSVAIILGGLIYILIFAVLIQVPSLLTWVFIHDLATNELIYIMPSLFAALITILYIIILAGILIFNFLRRKVQNVSQRAMEKTKVLSVYTFSLLPYVFFLTQLPFILIHGGHYFLFGLFPLYIALWVGLSSWHFSLFYLAIRLTMSKRTAIIIISGYIATCVAFVVFWAWFINFSNWSITILGYLFG